MRYPCLQCDYAATKAGNLKRHVENEHEGVLNVIILQLQQVNWRHM